jgi:hypothetical protein
MTNIQPEQIDGNLPLPTSETASAWRRLRLANRDDESEFQRLFGLMVAEQGIEGHNEHKALTQFDGAVRLDRAALVVAETRSTAKRQQLERWQNFPSCPSASWRAPWMGS